LGGGHPLYDVLTHETKKGELGQHKIKSNFCKPSNYTCFSLTIKMALNNVKTQIHLPLAYEPSQAIRQEDEK